MTKKKAKITVVVLVLVLAGLLYTAAFGIGSSGEGAAKNIKTGLDLSGGVSITYQVVGEETPSVEDMADTINKLQLRVENYSTEAQVYQEGTDRINIEIPGVSDANQVLSDLGKPGSLEFQDPTGTVVLQGSDVKDAQAASQNDSLGNTEYVVKLEFNDDAAKIFADVTKENVGKSISIVYDGSVISAPRVNEAITGGSCVISGSFTLESARTLASYIRIGSLSLELEELRSNVVGAQLGEEAIRTSLIAGAIGIVCVIVFMIVVYLLPGFVAGFGLITYVALILVLLNGFEITLTLPGIAGIILGIGMAVDANVIIYARIREEIAAGAGVKSAIKTGFSKALSAIVDGNITTFIAGVVLNFMGSGSVKGFAQTLMLGIVVSMFTALIVSRLLLNALFTLGFKDEKFYGRSKDKKPINFLAHKKAFFAISIIMILAGPVIMGINSSRGIGGLNLSLDFVGGTSTTVNFNEDYSIDQIDSDIKPLFMEITKDANVQAQKVNDSNEVIFKTRELTLDERKELAQKLEDTYEIDTNEIATESISSTISGEMRQAAVIAVIIATICMLLYIWFRFSDIRFAASAVLALLHDVLVVLAFYAIARVSVGNTFIACMLTLVGYSINATIVIFDRIRENLKSANKKTDLANLVNESITSTLTRSIYTSLTTFIMVAILYVMGVASIKEFAAPLMCGILIGGYSSVCVTGALWFVMKTAGNKSSKKSK